MLTDEQINEFAEQGFVLVPQVVQGDVLAQAARRIDEVVAVNPPAADKRGNHFYFLETRRALYYQISAVDHASHRGEFLQDPWLDYQPIRSQPTAPPTPPLSG